MKNGAKKFKYALRMSLTGWFVALVLSAGDSSLLASKGGSRRLTNSVSIPDGTLIEVRMIDEVNTGANKVGDSFEASLARDLNVGGRQIARKDSPARGRVVEVVSSGRLKRPALISLKLTELTLSDGRTVSIETSPYSIDGKSHALRNVGLIGGGAGAGAVYWERSGRWCRHGRCVPYRKRGNCDSAGDQPSLHHRGRWFNYPSLFGVA